MQTNNPLTKFSLKQWVQHPTTILLMAMTLISWSAVGVLLARTDTQVEDCRDRVAVLEEREADRLKMDQEREAKLQDYIRAVMFKDNQINKQAIIIDSLRKNEQ